MSRRPTSTPQRHRRERVVGLALLLVLAMTASLSAMTSAQDDKISDSDVEWGWQLLTYRGADGDIESVPAGVGATMNLFFGSAFGEAACSTYEATFTKQYPSLFIDPPQVERFACDPISQAFDDVFYANLAATQSISVSESILTLRDQITEPMMTLTRARIEDDPTVARWSLARIADPDGSIEPVIQGLDPWIEFLRGGRLVGNTGCGSFIGSYTINDGSMDVSDVAYRLDACTEGARRQAERVLATLDEVTDFVVLPAGLALKDAAGTTRLALTPDIDLGSRTWTPVVVYGDDGETLFAVEDLSNAAVRFTDRYAEGWAVCRSFTGDSLRSGLAVSVTNIEIVAPRCTSSTDVAIERAFINALKLAASHALRGDELELKDVDGNTLMRLAPQAELVGPTWVVDWMDVTPTAAKPRQRAPIKGTTITADFLDIEVLLGETGAADRTGTNGYVADYRTPKAAGITITGIKVDGRACQGAKARNAECRQEERYKQLLGLADAYIANVDGLKLLKGSRTIIFLKPEVLEVEGE